MPNEKSAVEQFLSEPSDEKSPFKSETQDPFNNQVIEQKEEEMTEDVEEEKPLPFHKDPKVQRYVEKQIAKALESVPKTVEKREVSEEDEISDVLVRIIGNDTPEKQSAVKDFRKVLGSLEERGVQKALSQFEAQASKQREEDEKAQEELDESFEEIEDTFKVDLSSNAPSARKQRSEFIEYIRKIAPKNEEGEVIAFPDLNAAFEEFQEKGKRAAPSNSKAKELAARGMSHSSDASAQPVKGGSWKDVERLFSRLS